ncbi:DUF655 domain-containing protein [Candidatus Woesearchaeota archaeon]|nr:DUF655 domain-containing protein [Candidatus Woesearchaeota archaeon]
MNKEENCVILDFLHTGYSDRRHPEPIAQALGTQFFSLLELVPREGVILKQEQDVYIGEGKRPDIRFIRGQMEYDKLTSVAKSTLPDVIEKIVLANEQKFIDFFNRAGPLTPRMHALQLLPGVGKKHLLDILNERRKKPFESYADLRTRLGMFPDIVKSVVQRVLDELQGNEKYFLFTMQPRQENRMNAR